MIRTFVAISLPNKNLEQVENWIKQLRQLEIQARFPRIESIHLTLKFLGEIEDSRVNKISEVLDSAVSSISEFDLEISGMGAFPTPRNPRVVWLGVAKCEALNMLQGSIDGKLANCGFKPESKPFKPHLTLARIKSKRNLENLQTLLKGKGFLAEAGRFTVNQIHLYRSILHPTGAEYRRLTTHSLEAE